MKKKFKAKVNDSERGNYWVVWDHVCEYRYAEFYGKFSKHYAQAHTKRLNSLPEKDQP